MGLRYEADPAMHAIADPLDIVAVALLVIFSLRRFDVNATDRRAFPGVATEAFERWRSRALRSKAVAIHASFFKIFLNVIWFYGFGSRLSRSVIAVGGFSIFACWVSALTYAWWLSSGAKTLAAEHGIVVGTRFTEKKAPSSE